MEYGLIGEKLGHSFSKTIHEKLASYIYEICELKPNELDSFFKEKSFKSINVTIPYKETVIKYLDELDESAKLVGAVNTIVNNDGYLIGYNTDYLGLNYLVKKLGLNLENKKVLILGAGGASKACYAVCKMNGASQILKSDFNHLDGVISFDEISDHLDVDFIFNATPVGMYPKNDGKLIDLDKFSNLVGFIDCIYNPLSTNLVLDARSLNIPSMGGLYMLVAQAYFAVEFFLRKKLDISLIDKIYKELVKEKDNIVLIGMPSCGKSTIGELLSKKLKKQYVDIDLLIEEKINSSIKDYIDKNGEDSFRNIEEEVVKDISKLNNQIISCGGGVIKRKININNLKQNGKIYFIDRSLELLTPTATRPLSNDLNKLKKLYEERYPIYLDDSDYHIDNNQEIEDAVNKIIEVYKNENPSY